MNRSHLLKGGSNQITINENKAELIYFVLKSIFENTDVTSSSKLLGFTLDNNLT